MVIELRKIEGLVADGYTAAEIYRVEQCDAHDFRLYKTVDIVTNEEKVLMACNKCDADEHIARMLGDDPYRLEEAELFV